MLMGCHSIEVLRTIFFYPPAHHLSLAIQLIVTCLIATTLNTQYQTIVCISQRRSVKQTIAYYLLAYMLNVCKQCILTTAIYRSPNVEAAMCKKQRMIDNTCKVD